MGCSGSSSAEEKKNEIQPKSKQISKYSSTDIRKNYEFIYMLGNGAFGKVRLYRDRSNKDLLYAIKTLKKEGIPPYQFGLIKSEVAILSELDHPNIVRYFGTFEDNYYIHIIMEYLKGHDLYKILSLKDYTGFDEKDMSLIIFQLLKALVFIHSKNIVHRDIKPENILFSNKDDYTSLKLIDFGLATNKLKEKKSVGTPYYMSPEIIQGVSDPKTDVWSVGVIMHQMLTGKYPFYSNGKDSLLDLIEKKKFDSSLLDSSDCSDEAKDMVKKILIKDWTKRLSSKQCLEHPWIKKYATQKDSHLLNAQTIKTLKQFSTKSALQKEIYFFIAKVSKEKEILQLKQLFNQLDTKNAGSLTISEIEKAFAEIGIIIPDEDLKMIWEGLDFHKDGEVNYTEFLAAMVSSYKFEKEEKLWTVFNYFKDNTNKNNKSIFDSEDYISFDSLLNAVNSLNLNINEQAIKNNFEQFKGKKINFEQFKQIILSSEEKI